MMSYDTVHLFLRDVVHRDRLTSQTPWQNTKNDEHPAPTTKLDIFFGIVKLHFHTKTFYVIFYTKRVSYETSRFYLKDLA